LAKQQDWKKLLKADPTDWLLEEADPGVRYLALRDIVNADEKEIKAARRKAHREGPIALILANMNPEGWWVRPGFGDMHHFKGTGFSIISLAQLGGSIEEDKRIGTACSYYLDHALTKGGQFAPIWKPTGTAHCLQGDMLTSLMDLKFKDKRLDIAYEWMARTVTGEGLPKRLNADGFDAAKGGPGPYRYLRRFEGPIFACTTNKHLSCAWGGVNVMMAFSRLPKVGRTSLIEQAVEAGLKYFFSVDPSTANFPGERAPEPNFRWWKFAFPVLPSDIIKLAESLTALGYGGDPKLAKTLDLILSKQDENGRWTLEYVDHKHKMWVEYGSQEKPNKWVTLRAMRVLKQAGEQM